MDKSWLLNPKAIRIAKECIYIVKEELGVKLTLSHPEFMQMLHEYVDLTDSADLADAYSRLLAMAGVGNVVHNLKSKAQTEKVVPIVAEKQAMKSAVGAEVTEEELIEYCGKSYARWRDGKEFSGLYRGQPRYG